MLKKYNIMRKETSNLSVKEHNFYSLIVRATKSNIKILIVLLVLFTSINSFSQVLTKPKQNSEIISTSVIKVDDYLKVLSQLRKKSNSVNPHDYLLSLLKDLKSTVYFKDGLVKVYGNSASCLRSDITSLKLASNNLALLKDIEIVTINIDNPKDLNKPIDLSFTTKLRKVRYVYLLLSFDVNPEILSNLIKNVNNESVVMYSIDNRS
jgi:hypothetical protein